MVEKCFTDADFEVDFADEHPESQVTGVDLSPIQPKFVPPNWYVSALLQRYIALTIPKISAMYQYSSFLRPTQAT